VFNMKVPHGQRKMIALLAVVFFIGVIHIANLNVRGLFVSVFAPLHGMIWGADSQNSNSNIEEVFDLRQQVIALQDAQEENDELRRALALEIHQDFQFVEAVPFGKHIAEDTLLISIEDVSHVKEGMPVITPGKVVVGRVGRVDGKAATVKLISEKGNSISAQVSNSPITGIIRGKGASGMLLDLVPHEDTLVAGDVLVTTTLGGIFPKNLLIGEITQVIQEGTDSFQKAEVNPFFDMKKTNLLFVITQYSI
jgi:rod shape-determining protein MreC